MNCPVCRAPNAPSELRCVQCGADFHDPDVRALAPGDSSELPSASLGEGGELAADRFLGVRLPGLLEGRALGLMAMLGAIALVCVALVPVSEDYQSWLMPWAAADGGPALSLFYPLVAAAVGFAVFALGRTPTWMRGAALLATSLVGILFTLAPLGPYAAGPTSLPVVFTIGMVIAGVGLALRLYHPLLGEARHIVASGAAVALVGMLLPVDVRAHLPAEFSWKMWRGQEIVEASMMSTFFEGSGTDAMVQLLSWWGLLPVVLLPTAVALAWPRPAGVWDRTALPLRPIAWLVVLYLPLTWLAYLFNMTGWDDLEWVRYGGHYAKFDDFAMTATVGRAKVAVAAGAYALWATFGSVVLYQHVRLRSPTKT